MQAHQDPDQKQPLLENPRYRKLQTLGKGAFGFVQLAEDTLAKEKVAIKFLQRGDKVNKYVERELLVHRILKHPHVIQFREVFLTSEYLCIAMEYASGGTLFSFVQTAGRLKEVVARWFFQQLIIGVDYCHKKGVVNRDIKLENTLLDYVPGLPLPLLKICDFGYSKADFMSDPKSKVGTPVYMAPEVILTTSQRYDGKLADIWSCGVMLYVMLVGQYPFDSNTWREVARANRTPQAAQEVLSAIRPNIPSQVELSPPCRDLLLKLLTGDPNRRLSMESIVAHQWFQTHLPSNAMTMNNQYLGQPPAGLQTDPQIQQILASARTAPAAKKEDQDLLDDVIDYEIEEDLKNEVYDHGHAGHGGHGGQHAGYGGHNQAHAQAHGQAHGQAHQHVQSHAQSHNHGGHTHAGHGHGQATHTYGQSQQQQAQAQAHSYAHIRRR